MRLFLIPASYQEKTISSSQERGGEEGGREEGELGGCRELPLLMAAVMLPSVRPSVRSLMLQEARPGSPKRQRNFNAELILAIPV